MGAAHNAPILIRRKKVIAGDGHHGGAWKVAYADFVTAMMAFFMLMWLLNATTEQQRKGIADYFSPTVPLNRVSAGGDGMFGGESIMTRDALAQNGTGGGAADSGKAGEEAAEVAALRHVEDILIGRGGEALVSEKALRHVVTRITDEGLEIEVYSLPGAPIFDPDDRPSTLLREAMAGIAGAVSLVTNDVAVDGFVAVRTILRDDTPVWGKSVKRATGVQAMLLDHAIAPRRFARVTGHGDRDAAEGNGMTERSDRVKIILLRSDLAPPR